MGIESLQSQRIIEINRGLSTVMASVPVMESIRQKAVGPLGIAIGEYLHSDGDIYFHPEQPDQTPTKITLALKDSMTPVEGHVYWYGEISEWSNLGLIALIDLGNTQQSDYQDRLDDSFLLKVSPGGLGLEPSEDSVTLNEGSLSHLESCVEELVVACKK